MDIVPEPLDAPPFGAPTSPFGAPTSPFAQRGGRFRRAIHPRSVVGLIGIVSVAAILLLTVFLVPSLSPTPSGSSVSPSAVSAGAGTTYSLMLPPASDSGALAGSGAGARLEVSISASPGYALGPLKTTFTSTVTGGTRPYTYDWQFGDNTESKVADPAHTYAVGETYLVTLNVRDSAGKSASAEAFVTAATAADGTLTVQSSLGDLPSMFWGYNYDYQSGAGGFANPTVAGYLNQTPVVWLRLPITDDSYTHPATWEALAKFCKWTDCKMIATVGGPGVSPAEAVAAMKRAVSYGLDPTYWAFGNEPDLWFSAGHPTSGLQYADLVKAWITLAQPVFPHAKFIGAEITGHAKFGDAYIYNVTKVDGHLISAMAIQLYPQFGYATVSGFLRSLTVANSVGAGIPRVAGIMKSACPTCSVPILLNEFQGGSGYNEKYVPMREGFPDATLFAASIVQAVNVHLMQFAPWTVTGSPSGQMSHPGNCEMGLIQLNTLCTGSILGPVYYLYSNILSRFPYGALSNVTVKSSGAVYAVQVVNGTRTVVLVVNANPAAITEDLTLGAGFPTKGTLTTYLMDLQHVATPLTATIKLSAGTKTTVVLPPLGIMLLSFSGSAGGGTQASASGATPGAGGASPTASASGLTAVGSHLLGLFSGAGLLGMIASGQMGWAALALSAGVVALAIQERPSKRVLRDQIRPIPPTILDRREQTDPVSLLIG